MSASVWPDADRRPIAKTCRALLSTCGDLRENRTEVDFENRTEVDFGATFGVSGRKWDLSLSLGRLSRPGKNQLNDNQGSWAKKVPICKSANIESPHRRVISECELNDLARNTTLPRSRTTSYYARWNGFCEMDFEVLKPTSRVKFAGAATGITAFWMFLFANQTFHIVHFRGIFAVIVVFKFVLALSFAVLALQVFKMRKWGIYAAMTAGALTTLLSLGWLVFILMNSVVSLMPFMVIPCAATTAGLAFLARADVNRAEAEREKLEDEGLDLGV
jgi:hypothetical protein